MKFVILDHVPPQPSTDSAARTRTRHFDLMFEIADEDSLRTYSLTQLPIDPGTDAEVCPLENHRSEYLTYEGPVSNNRGFVKRFAQGEWSGELGGEVVLSFDDASENFAGAEWTIRIDSTRNSLLRIA